MPRTVDDSSYSKDGLYNEIQTDKTIEAFKHIPKVTNPKIKFHEIPSAVQEDGMDHKLLVGSYCNQPVHAYVFRAQSKHLNQVVLHSKNRTLSINLSSRKDEDAEPLKLVKFNYPFDQVNMNTFWNWRNELRFLVLFYFLEGEYLDELCLANKGLAHLKRAFKSVAAASIARPLITLTAQDDDRPTKKQKTTPETSRLPEFLTRERRIKREPSLDEPSDDDFEDNGPSFAGPSGDQAQDDELSPDRLGDIDLQLSPTSYRHLYGNDTDDEDDDMISKNNDYSTMRKDKQHATTPMDDDHSTIRKDKAPAITALAGHTPTISKINNHGLTKQPMSYSLSKPNVGSAHLAAPKTDTISKLVYTPRIIGTGPTSFNFGHSGMTATEQLRQAEQKHQKELQDEKAKIKELQDQHLRKDIQIKELQEKLQGKDSQIKELQDKLQDKEADVKELQALHLEKDGRIKELQDKFREAQDEDTLVEELQDHRPQENEMQIQEVQNEPQDEPKDEPQDTEDTKPSNQASVELELQIQDQIRRDVELQDEQDEDKEHRVEQNALEQGQPVATGCGLI